MARSLPFTRLILKGIKMKHSKAFVGVAAAVVALAGQAWAGDGDNDKPAAAPSTVRLSAGDFSLSFSTYTAMKIELRMGDIVIERGGAGVELTLKENLGEVRIRPEPGRMVIAVDSAGPAGTASTNAALAPAPRPVAAAAAAKPSCADSKRPAWLVEAEAKSVQVRDGRIFLAPDEDRYGPADPRVRKLDMQVRTARDSGKR
jgi:hypothetical protein